MAVAQQRDLPDLSKALFFQKTYYKVDRCEHVFP